MLVAALKKVTDAIFSILEGVGFGIGKVAEFGNWLSSKFDFGGDSTKKLPVISELASTVKTDLVQSGTPAPVSTSNAATYNDNKTVTIQLATNDPAQAAEQIQRALEQYNVNTPGQFAPMAQ